MTGSIAGRGSADISTLTTSYILLSQILFLYSEVHSAGPNNSSECFYKDLEFISTRMYNLTLSITTHFILDDTFLQ